MDWALAMYSMENRLEKEAMERAQANSNSYRNRRSG